MSSHKRPISSDERPRKFPRLTGGSSAQSAHDVTNQAMPNTSAPPGTNPLPSVFTVPCPSSSAGPAPAPLNVQPPNITAAGAFRTVLGSGLLRPVVGIFDELFAAYKDKEAVDEDYAELNRKLQGLRITLDQSFSSNVSASTAKRIDDLRGLIEQELDHISSREKKGAGRRFLQANKDLAKVTKCFRQICDHVDTVMLEIVRSHGQTLTQQQKVLGEHAKRLDEQARFAEERERFAKEQAIENRLDALEPSLAACYRSSEAATLLRRECTPNTRKEVLLGLDHWRRGANQGNIFWLNGMAGTGKTTIANTLCATLKTEQKLGASFFCTRQLPECRSVELILPTIAYQLARFSRPLRDALSQALESDPDLRTKDLPTQLEGLIIDPLRQISVPVPTDLVIVIDALDECEDRDGVGWILELLVNHASELPIKVFVTSRPEEQIRRNVGSTKAQLVLHELDNKIVKGDIEIYLRAELADTSVSESQLSQLVERAGVLFIYAATVVRYIKAKNSWTGQQARLNIVLTTSPSSSSNKNKDIDALYSAVLASAFSNPDLDKEDVDEMRLVLHTVVCAQEPLTVKTLAGLLQLADGGPVRDALEPLWSVLHVSESGDDSLVTTLHASFPDYMFDRGRSGDCHCDAQSYHGQLAELCFERIEQNERKFNVCELESSYLFDDEVPGLDERVKLAIPLDLSYACLYWAVHLELGGRSSDRIQLLENFLSKQLLLWMEVLNLKKRMNVGAMLLAKARKWCMNGGGSEATQILIHDAWRFATTFAANPVSRSTPHLYVSMLASWPSSRLIQPCYIERAGGLVEVGGSGMSRRQLVLLGVFPMGSTVFSVVFSPDGTRIICGCLDGIRVWDAQSGKMVLGPLKGETTSRSVFSVACSPDGHLIASSSDDRTILVWDARSGEVVLEPLKGHTGRIQSVAFSPDSTQIVSASSDATIRAWDAQTGKVVLGPLEGHTDWVYSVAFSPDGKRIVSGSKDNTIRIWDSQRGQLVLGPLKGHTGLVYSVAFSPDSRHIVSGSYDGTIRVWDAQTGETILRPLDGCTAPVNAVAYSPDGVHIVSCSKKAIRVWDTRSGQVVLGPLEGHTYKVTSVAFSPDGMRVVSGSDDTTIRVWDAESRETSLGSSDGHTEPAISVAFAPDGMRIASGSADCTIRVWDVQSGKMLLGPLEGHTDEVHSVAFSPDSTRIVSGSYDKTIRVWDSQSGMMALGPLTGHTRGVRSVTFSPDGARIISGSNDDTIRVWDSQSGNVVLGPLKGHIHHGVLSVGVSPDGRHIVSGSSADTTQVWDAQNGRVVVGPLKGHTHWVNSVAFSPDGTRIVSGSRDKTLRVWDAQTGKMMLEPLKGHTGSVNSVVFSPDGTCIVSGSQDMTLRIWSAQTGELVLAPLHGHILPVLSISFSPNSTHIASCSMDKTIRVWCLPGRQSAANTKPRSSSTRFPSHAVANSSIYQPSLSHLASSGTLPPWTINEDGWVVDENRHLWLWVPPDLRVSLMMPDNTILISTHGSVQLNFDRASMGELWTKCYIPA